MAETIKTTVQATPSQKDAISVRDRSVLVSAGAGSGKTWVLTERLMSYVLDRENPIDITRFVVITFTQASAAELRSRITEELGKALAVSEKDPSASDAWRGHIRRQQALIRKAPIGTIHHFCSLILRESGHMVGLTSDFRILSEERASAMKAELLDRILTARYEEIERDTGFEALVNSVGSGRDDSRLAQVILTLYERMQSHPFPEAWANQCIDAMRNVPDDIGMTLWGEELLTNAAKVTDYWIGEMERILAAMAEDEVTSAAYLEGFSVGADALRERKRCLKRGWEAARACPAVTFGRLKGIKEAQRSALSEFAKERKKACLDAMKKIDMLLIPDFESLKRETEKTAPAMEALLKIVLEFDRLYTKQKRENSLADYADLEHCTARLLTEASADGTLIPTELAKSIAKRYREIMVDEYQDVSRVQEAIFQAVSREKKNLFLVGDVKQAIYRFRLADPEIFNDKYRRFGILKDAAPGESVKILLQENFRSRREILECANSVFSCCMTRELGDISYDEEAALKFGAEHAYEGSAPIPEMILLGREGPTDDTAEREKTRQEAAFVAEKILNLISAGATVSDKGKARPMCFGDIAILLRSANNVGPIFRKELRERGIPVESSQGGDFFEAKEISFVMALLKTMDTPKDEIELSALLASPFFAFEPDELAAIRNSDKDASFYDALKKAATTQPKCATFLETLQSLRAEAPDLTAEKLLNRILHRTEILSVCAAMPDGSLRMANLYHLLELAKRFEADGYQGLHRFILYLERLQARGTEISASEVSSNCVRILSIHRSKGLEFPVVFLCDTARMFNLRDSAEPVLIHPSLGLGPKLTDMELKVQYPTMARRAIAQRLRRETLSEEMRLLYVALTRPKERLFITAIVKQPEDYLLKQQQSLLLSEKKLESEMLKKCSCYADWLTLSAFVDRQQHLKITVAEKEEATEIRGEESKTAENEAYSEELRQRLVKNLSFSYSYSEAEKLPSKITATELKNYLSDGQTEDDETAQLIPRKAGKQSFRRPEFTLEERATTASERGIATHLALQYMNFADSETAEGIAAEIQRLKERRFLSERQAAAVNQGAIYQLFHSPLGERLRRAAAVHRELRFSLLCKASVFLPDAPEEEILLQGVVDCCLEEEGELVIIDYKTDSITNKKQTEERIALYISQVKAYAYALEKMFHKHVKETILYFLSNGEAVSMK